jgi:hypothetical protein
LRDDSLGQIMKSNLLFSSFFGYQIDQIQGKSINIILPNILKIYHDSFLLRFNEDILDPEFMSEYLETE